MRISTIVGIFAMILTLVPDVVFAETDIDTKPTGRLTMEAASGNLMGDILTLNGVKNVIYSINQGDKSKDVRMMTTSQFIEHFPIFIDQKSFNNYSEKMKKMTELTMQKQSKLIREYCPELQEKLEIREKTRDTSMTEEIDSLRQKCEKDFPDLPNQVVQLSDDSKIEQMTEQMTDIMAKNKIGTFSVGRNDGGTEITLKEAKLVNESIHFKVERTKGSTTKLQEFGSALVHIDISLIGVCGTLMLSGHHAKDMFNLLCN